CGQESHRGENDAHCTGMWYGNVYRGRCPMETSGPARRKRSRCSSGVGTGMEPAANISGRQGDSRYTVNLDGLNILVVEDDTDTRELLRLVLETQGGAVRAASSVPEALTAYDQARPDILIADIGMPEYNGYTLIGRVRAR